MKMTIADQIRDAIIPHQVQIERIKAGHQRTILALLREIEKEVYGEIMTSGLYEPKRPSYRERRLKALLISIDDSLKKFAPKARGLNKKELVKVAKLAESFTQKSMNTALNADIFVGAFSQAELTAIATNTLIDGAPSAQWWADQDKTLRRDFTNRVRKGFVQGKPTGEIVRSIRGTKATGFRDGIMKRVKGRATALVRTSIQTVANQARLNTYEKHDDLIDGIEWSATLDEKTTDICIGLDGLAWTLPNYKPSGHTVTFPGPTAHWQCRSQQVPQLVPFEKLAKKNKALARKLDKALDSGTRSSMHGPVSNRLGYEAWLRQLEKANPGAADAILGPSKARLWRKGTLNFRQLVDESARPLTVDELL